MASVVELLPAAVGSLVVVVLSLDVPVDGDEGPFPPEFGLAFRGRGVTGTAWYRSVRYLPVQNDFKRFYRHNRFRSRHLVVHRLGGIKNADGGSSAVARLRIAVRA